MAQDTVPPPSFWDLAIPEQGAHAVVELFGTAAMAEAIRLALEARAAGDEDNYRFWTAVYARVFMDGFRQTSRIVP